MTITVATPRSALRGVSATPPDHTLLLMLPALAMLVLMFLVPLALFLLIRHLPQPIPIWYKS